MLFMDYDERYVNVNLDDDDFFCTEHRHQGIFSCTPKLKCVVMDENGTEVKML